MNFVLQKKELKLRFRSIFFVPLLHQLNNLLIGQEFIRKDDIDRLKKGWRVERNYSLLYTYLFYWELNCSRMLCARATNFSSYVDTSSNFLSFFNLAILLLCD